MDMATTLATALTAVVFAGGGAAALAAAPPLTATWARLGISQQLGRTTGALELAAAAGLVLSIWAAPAVGLAAAVGLVALMIGAVAYHLRADDAAGAAAPAVLGVVSATTAILIATNGL